ncbi:MAG TPA: 1,4-dihydroxy-2-naphthoyl-CoA synthase [Microbacteriaceae bacterium]|jgi:naphthoate synthase|nr:1,4-dihydroxy-2-naphthoyl-CoA synthase [Microbacteriaceae bacterium]
MTTTFDDILYDVDGPIATITINRPDRYNAFRAQTVDELISAFNLAWADRGVQSVILTGTGEKAFCAGGDVKQRAATGDYGPSEMGFIRVEELHRQMRDMPKPVIAAVNGFAIGGGHVLHVICDLSIAAEHATFGQVGPRVGSFDGGFGSLYLARVIGEKRAREVWYLCRQYDAQTAERWGLVNKVVPGPQLMEEARAWALELAAKSPTALRFLKHAFNADSEHQAGIANLSRAGVDLYYETEEGREGAKAFAEKREPDFAQYVR